MDTYFASSLGELYDKSDRHLSFFPEIVEIIYNIPEIVLAHDIGDSFSSTHNIKKPYEARYVIYTINNFKYWENQIERDLRLKLLAEVPNGKLFKYISGYIMGTHAPFTIKDTALLSCSKNEGYEFWQKIEILK